MGKEIDPRLIRAVSNMLARERKADDYYKQKGFVPWKFFETEKQQKKRLSAFVFEKGLHADFEKFCEKCDRSEIDYPTFVLIHSMAEELQRKGFNPDDEKLNICHN